MLILFQTHHIPNSNPDDVHTPLNFCNISPCVLSFFLFICLGRWSHVRLIISLSISVYFAVFLCLISCVMASPIGVKTLPEYVTLPQADPQKCWSQLGSTFFGRGGGMGAANSYINYQHDSVCIYFLINKVYCINSSIIWDAGGLLVNFNKWDGFMWGEGCAGWYSSDEHEHERVHLWWLSRLLESG